jgi:hydrogenase/urease accessory protein HupE
MVNSLHRLLLGLLLLSVLSPLHAHKMRPAIVDIGFDRNATVTIRVQANAEALLAGIGPQHDNTDDAPQAQVYRELRDLPASRLQQKFADFADEYSKGLRLELSGLAARWRFVAIEVPEVGDVRLSRKSVIEYQAPIPVGASEAVWSYDARYGDAVVNFSIAGQSERVSHWLVNGEKSPPLPLHQSVIPRHWTDVALDYTGLGYLHILPKGLDHILFVLGLFLLSLRFSPLLWQVTAFTIAHSITLAMSIYGLIEVSPLIVEPLIALSIAYVGIENVLTRQLKPWRVIIVFLFGLLHGMGFAGVLLELGLPESEFLTALITFNVGVELGQLSVIALALVVVFWIRKREDLYRRVVVVPGSLIIAVTGLYWTVERVI